MRCSAITRRSRIIGQRETLNKPRAAEEEKTDGREEKKREREKEREREREETRFIRDR